MKRIYNIFYRLIMFVLLTVVWSSSAWAERFQPTYSASLDRTSSNWYYIQMFNKGVNGYLYSQNEGGHVKHGANSVANPSYIWQLVGDNTNGFMLVTMNGYYGYWDNGFLTGTTNPTRAEKFRLINGTDADSWAIQKFTSSGTSDCLNPQGSNEIKTWNSDNGCRVRFHSVTPENIATARNAYFANILVFSSEPSATGWDANTHWYTMRNNRSNQSGHNRKWISTSAVSVNDAFELLPNQATMPADLGSYWCFVGDNEHGFVIQNAAYGPDFVLGIRGGDPSIVKMLPKEETAGYTTVFTAVDNSVTDGATRAYAFRLGTSGNSHIHVTQGRFITYNHSAISGGDTGSAFMLTSVSNDAIAAMQQYDVYKVLLTGVSASETSISYQTSANVFGKRGVVENGSYLIFSHGSSTDAAQFAVSNSEYSISTSVSDDPAHAYSLLTIRINDIHATEAWQFVITDNYKVVYAGTEYADNEVFYMRPGKAPNHIDFTINAPADKFVWGPVISKANKTVAYDVRDLVTADEFTDGWYQMQLNLASSEISNIAAKIKSEEGNVNTASNTLYLAPSVFDTGVGNVFKVTGVPVYAGETSTYVYLSKRGDHTVDFTNPRTGAVSSVHTSFDDGHLEIQTTNGWGVENNAHPFEGPYITSGNYPFVFNMHKADVSDYTIYQVHITGPGVTTSTRVTVSSSNVVGNNTVGNGGFFFMPRTSNAPLRSQYSVNDANISVAGVTLGTMSDGVVPVNIEVSQRQHFWDLRIIGDAANLISDRVTYDNMDYVSGAHVAIPYGVTPTALDFKTNITDRFVWGPVIDYNMQTVTFEVRETAASLTSGTWVQMVMRDKAGQVFFNNNVVNKNSIVDGINELPTLRKQGNYIYPITAGVTDWPVELTGYTGEDLRANTFIYIKNVSGNNVTMMMQNGKFLNQNGQGSDADNNTVPFVYQPDVKSFKWNSNALPWDNLRNGKVGVGNTGRAQNGNMEFFVAPVRVKAYKIAGIDGYKVEYKGDAKVIGSRKVNGGMMLFLEEGETIEGEGSTIDISKFVVNNGAYAINSIASSAGIGCTVLTFNATIPSYGKEIIHVQNRYYDYLETDSNKPGDGFIQDGEGWNVRTGNNSVVIREQNTSVFEIPIYLKQGTSFTSYMPTNELKSYQRWFDWDTDGQVSSAVFTPTWTISDAQTYTNGKLSGESYGGYHSDPRFTLPFGMESYNVGLDLARFGNGGSRGNGSLVEPTIGMRVVYQIRDAKQIANAIKTANDGGKFFEVHNIALPNIQYGSRASRLEDRTLSTTLPIDMDLNNYWGFNGGGTGNENLVQLTQDNQLRVVVEGGNAPIQNVMMIPGSKSNASGQINRTSFNTGHFVLFQYPDNGYIEPNSTATINVYMTSGSVEYKLVQFNLTFIGNSHPIVITELKDSYRHPDALVEEFGAPVTELTFDQTPNFEYSTTEAGVNYPDYRYPLDYKGASYAFGARNGRNWAASRGEYALTSLSGSSTQTGTPRVIYYPVVNYLRSMADPSAALGSKIDGAYQLYIDAADQPGKIASIELRDALCAGSRLYCYGYIGCTSGGTNYHPTSVLINVMGINKDTHKEELIYSYCPGIITLRGYAEDGRTIYSTAMGSSSSYSQRSGGEDRNYWAPWQQIGFSFAISAEVAARMEGYSIQIMNNAYNSTGGDTMLDDFQIFVKKPGAEVANTTPLCSDQIRHIKVITEYNTLIEATGEDSNHDGMMNVGFCFLDKEVYDQALIDYAANIDLPRTDAENTYNKAFGLALMGNRTLDKTNKDHAFHNFDIIRDGEISTIDGDTKVHYYTDIPQYSFKESMDDRVYRDSIRGERYIVFKESVAHGEASGLGNHKWTAGKSYYLLFSTATITAEHVNNHDLACTVFNLDDNKCSVLYEFTVAPPVSIRGDVERITSGDEVQACDGQTATLAVNLNGRTDTKDVIIKNLKYDWWMSAPTHVVYKMENGVPVRDANGNRIPVDENGDDVTINADGTPLYPDAVQTMEYNTVPATLENYNHVWYGYYSEDHYHLGTHAGDKIYLRDALLEFRRAYPDAVDLIGVKPIKRQGDLVEYDLTQEIIDCVAHFLEPDENGYPPLLLMKKEMNLTLGLDYADKNKVVHFVVIPIAPSIYSVDEDAIYCPDPQELKVTLLNAAPTLANGFNDMTYPETMNNVPVRVGLQQIDAVRKVVDPAYQKTLTIPLRKARFAYDDGRYLIKQQEADTLFIVGTDDPAYKDIYRDSVNTLLPDIDDMFIPAGFVNQLIVGRDDINPSMQIIIDSNVRLREGYTYTMKVKYYEVRADGSTRDMACDGSFVFDLKIVPEYQVWTASVNSDWTNDSNWRRADRDDLHAGDNVAVGDGLKNATSLNDGHSYASNTDNETEHSFVPMYFTNVLFDNEASTTASLYNVTAASRMSKAFLDGLESTATYNIQFELEVTPTDMVSRNGFEFDCNYECELFGTNIARGISFEPQSQLVNAHYLDYQKAWVEYELDNDRWYTLSSPLQNTYAGEWYAPTNGARQLTPHFYGINYRTNLNDRFRPAIYQRSWDSEGNNPVYLKTGGSQDSYVRADWSYVYNDVKKEYSAGGFSVKVSLDHMNPALRPANGKALVRMPKADTQYTYYDLGGSTGQKSDDLLPMYELAPSGEAVLKAGANPSRLWSDKLASGTEFTQTIANVSTGNDYFLVGNPFVANMDMEAFFAANTQFEPKYWIMTASGQTVSAKTDIDSWTSTSGDGRYVGPLQGFFVKRKDGQNATDVTFTAAMQVAGPDGEALPTRASGDYVRSLTITTQRDGYVSAAIVQITDGAANAFEAAEDCQTFIDGSMMEIPTVYTSASGQAMTINRVNRIEMLPLGVISNDESMTSVTFALDNIADGDYMLYDKDADEFMPLTDGIEVSIPGNCNGRYFIVSHIGGGSTDDSEQPDGMKFNLQGMRVFGSDSGTIVIVNGKKVLVL